MSLTIDHAELRGPGDTSVGDAMPTHVVLPEPDAPEQRRRSTATFRIADVYSLVGAIVAALALTTLLFSVVLPFNGFIGFVVVTYLVFIAMYALLAAMDNPGPAVRNKVASVVIHSLAFLMLLALVFVIGYTLLRGFQVLFRANFFPQDLSRTGPLDGLEVGGITHAVVGTLIMIVIALVITVPLGITCAVFLNEMPGRFARFVRTIAEAMTALPSIIAGLFIYATFILILGFPKSGFAASLAISVMMLPIIIRSADVVLRLVPGTLREASYAMGTGQWRTVWHVVLPTARSGLATSVILGTARGIGETSPVLLTAGVTASMNTNPFSGPMVSLPLQVFEFVKSPENNFIIRGFGTASVLMLLVLFLFVIARIIGGKPAGVLSGRQMRRRMRQSHADALRFQTREAAVAAASLPAPPHDGTVDGPMTKDHR
jgi:phosphate transport system permease protein